MQATSPQKKVKHCDGMECKSRQSSSISLIGFHSAVLVHSVLQVASLAIFPGLTSLPLCGSNSSLRPQTSDCDLSDSPVPHYIGWPYASNKIC